MRFPIGPRTCAFLPSYGLIPFISILVYYYMNGIFRVSSGETRKRGLDASLQDKGLFINTHAQQQRTHFRGGVTERTRREREAQSRRTSSETKKTRVKSTKIPRRYSEGDKKENTSALSRPSLNPDTVLHREKRSYAKTERKTYAALELQIRNLPVAATGPHSRDLSAWASVARQKAVLSARRKMRERERDREPLRRAMLSM